MPPLHRAVALAEREDGSGGIGQQLDLDVARALEVPLAVERAVAEGAFCLAFGGSERVLELGRRADDPHAAPATPRGSLHEQRESDLLRRAVGEDGDIRLTGDPFRRELVSPEPECVGRRADPRQPCRLDGLGEVRTLGEEAVSGMDRIRRRGECCANVLLRVQVRGDLDRSIGRARMQRGHVVRCGDGHRLDPELAARAKHAHCDLAAVRYE